MGVALSTNTQPKVQQDVQRSSSSVQISEWCQEFETRRKFNDASKERLWIDFGEDDAIVGDQKTARKNGKDNIIFDFMSQRGQIWRQSSEAVINFLKQACPRDLRPARADSKTPRPQIAWLERYRWQDGDFECQQENHLLSEKELYIALLPLERRAAVAPLLHYIAEEDCTGGGGSVSGGSGGDAVSLSVIDDEPGADVDASATGKMAPLSRAISLGQPSQTDVADSRPATSWLNSLRGTYVSLSFNRNPLQQARSLVAGIWNGSSSRVAVDEEANQAARNEKSKSQVWDRQFMFINDITPLGLWALILTAPEREGRFLRDNFERYLAGKTYLAVDFPSVDITMFEFVLHLGYFSLQKVKAEEATTSCPMTEGAIDVSFMNRDPTVSRLILHRSQVSCFLRGIDWTRYWVLCLVRSTFFSKDGLRETTQSYWNTERADQVAWDPLAAGERLVDPIPSDPRDYWLCLVLVRVQVALNEWEIVREFLQDNTKAFRTVRPILNPVDIIVLELMVHRIEAYHQRRARDSRALLKPTVERLQKFLDEEARYFHSIKQENVVKRSLEGLRSCLRQLQLELDDLGEILEQFERLKEESEKEFILDQKKAATSNTRLGMIVVSITTLSAASAPYSMDKDVLAKVLPFLPMSFWAFAFFALSLILGVLGLAISLDVIHITAVSTVRERAVMAFANIDFAQLLRALSKKGRNNSNGRLVEDIELAAAANGAHLQVGTTLPRYRPPSQPSAPPETQR